MFTIWVLEGQVSEVSPLIEFGTMVSLSLLVFFSFPTRTLGFELSPFIKTILSTQTPIVHPVTPGIAVAGIRGPLHDASGF